jgi:hypothetical protein
MRRKSDYTLKNGHNSLIRGRRRLYIGSYESLGYDRYNRASQMFVRSLERRYSLAYFLYLEIGCAHLKILESRFSAYKRNYESKTITNQLFTFKGVGLVIKNLPAFDLLQFLKKSK